MNIVFYDGDCGFCNKTVQFILKNDKKNSIYFAAIQSDFARNFFKENHAPEPDMSTFYFFTESNLYSKSNASLALLRLLRFPFPLLQIGRIIPVCWRDNLYDFVAKKTTLAH